MSSREELTVGPGQTRNLVLSFDASETFHLFNKTIVTAILGSLFPASGFQGNQISNQKFIHWGGSEAKGTR